MEKLHNERHNLYLKLNPRRWNGMGTQHTWERREMHTKILIGKHQEKR